MDFSIDLPFTLSMEWPLILLIGAGVGFLSGMFGKGGSAVATPLLHAAGVPAAVALAAPLPATIPASAVASTAYWRDGHVDRDVLRRGLLLGLPAATVGALATRWLDGGALVDLTKVLVVALGLRVAFTPAAASEVERHPPSPVVVTALTLGVGFVSGLLANAGGFLLAPLYLGVLHLPVRRAFGTSLAVAMALAVPATGVHWLLGHLDWPLAAAFAATAVPASYVGARAGLRTDARRLERGYGILLTLLGLGLLLAG